MEKIDLRKARDFGQVFNDSIYFLKSNFKSFFGSVLLLAGPFVLLTGILLGYLQYITEKLRLAAVAASGFKSMSVFLNNSVSTTVLFLLIFILTTLVTNASIFLYFKTYDESPIQDLPVQRNSISALLTKACWRLFYNQIGLWVLILIVVLALIAVFSFLFKLPIMAVFVLPLLILAYLIFLPPLCYVFIAANFLVVRDEMFITQAILKAFSYLRGNFWSTWLLIFCTTISLSMLYVIFNLPATIFNMIRINNLIRNFEGGFVTGNAIFMIALSALSMLGSMLVISPVFSSFCIVNFYSQEERMEGKSLLHRIEVLDQPSNEK